MELAEHVMVDEVGGVRYERGTDGVWRYEGTNISVPGARDRTLTQHYRPSFIGVLGGEPELVYINAEVVEAAPRDLSWVTEASQPVADKDTGDVVAYVVPYEQWLSHDASAQGISAPEIDGPDAVAALARAERDVRHAQAQLEQALERRALALWEAIDSGVTRAEAAEITSLSAGRITQLLSRPEDLTEDLLGKQPYAKILELLRERGSMTAAELAAEGKTISFLSSKEKNARAHLNKLEILGAVSESGGHWTLTHDS